MSETERNADILALTEEQRRLNPHSYLSKVTESQGVVCFKEKGNWGPAIRVMGKLIKR